MTSVPLEQLLPHARSMRLITEVLRWDAASIECRATTHRDPDHPLRVNGRLSGICALEYGAQAMAVHGALIAAAAAPLRVGLLVAAHEFEWHVDRLDTVVNDLTVCAQRLVGTADQVVYTFEVSAAALQLASGRASVVLRIEPAEPG